MNTPNKLTMDEMCSPMGVAMYVIRIQKILESKGFREECPSTQGVYRHYWSCHKKAVLVWFDYSTYKWTAIRTK